MEENELLAGYRQIESKIIPVKDFLESQKDMDGYKGLYKGIITLQGPLVMNPEILFIGINAGDGAHYVLNNGSKTNNTPLRMIGHDQRCFDQLNWYEDGNARIEKKEKEGWVNYKWYQRDQKVNNPFTKNMIDFLYEIAKLKFPDAYAHQKYDNKTLPFWYETFGKSIMSTNLYPISTKNIGDLSKIHDSISNEKELQHLWEECKGHDKSINNWTVRKYFIKRVDELVKLVKPRIIVCMGSTAFYDFTYCAKKREKILFAEKSFGDTKIPVIGFSRRGQWAHLIPEISRHIVEKQLPVES